MNTSPTNTPTASNTTFLPIVSSPQIELSFSLLSVACFIPRLYTYLTENLKSIAKDSFQWIYTTQCTTRLLENIYLFIQRLSKNMHFLTFQIQTYPFNIIKLWSYFA